MIHSPYGCIPKITEQIFSKKYLYTHIQKRIITIAESWKQPKCPFMKEWISTMWSIYVVEYYAALKRQAILMCATTWRNLEDTMLSNLSQ